MPALGGRAFADAWPKDKAIHAIVPFSAGSTIDVVGRIVLDPVSRQLGQSIVVDNHGGAGGSIGSAIVAKVIAKEIVANIALAKAAGLKFN
jgi:tripartite-type tricarboxylate transporter receptor subunit TctC